MGARSSIRHARKDAWEPQVCTHMNQQNTIEPTYVRVLKKKKKEDNESSDVYDINLMYQW